METKLFLFFLKNRFKMQKIILSEEQKQVTEYVLKPLRILS